MSLQADLEEDLRSRSQRLSNRGILSHRKACTKCGSIKDKTIGFYRLKDTYCKTCHNERNRLHYSENPDDYLVRNWNSRNRAAGVQGKITIKEWIDLKALYKGRCAYCHMETDRLSPDHTRPLSWSRQHGFRTSEQIAQVTGWITNCRPACGRCNRAKSDDDPEDFLAWLDIVRGVNQAERERTNQEAEEMVGCQVGQEDGKTALHWDEAGQSGAAPSTEAIMERVRVAAQEANRS